MTKEPKPDPVPNEASDRVRDLTSKIRALTGERDALSRLRIEAVLDSGFNADDLAAVSALHRSTCQDLVRAAAGDPRRFVRKRKTALSASAV